MCLNIIIIIEIYEMLFFYSSNRKLLFNDINELRKCVFKDYLNFIYVSNLKIVLIFSF